MSAIKIRLRGGPLSDEEWAFVRAARSGNGYSLFRAHEGRFTEMRRVTRPVCLTPNVGFVDYEIAS